MQENKTDVIVVGAGPAGVAAAITIAKADKKVLLVERGSFAGSKNVFGGAIYVEPTKEIFPNFLESAPIERFITEHRYSLLTKQEATTINYKTTKTGTIKVTATYSGTKQYLKSSKNINIKVLAKK